MLTSAARMVHGRYTVIRKLAEGGMAEIFLARQHGSEGFEKPVVLKRIHSGFYADEQFRNMLVDEAHISMTLHHNNIVQVLDLGRSQGRMFLVLELVDGWDLSWVLERAASVKRDLPIGLGLYVMVEVCRALAYAHGRSDPDGNPMGIVHRDVSPQNVLVSDQGEVKLADFGIAKALTKRDRTAAGVVKGKIAFMSPEQALGGDIDARSDLFSLGTMIYLITTGVRPFEALTDFEILARVQKGDFRPPEEVKPEISPALAALIKRTMSRDRDHRYQTGEELLADLEGIWRAEQGSPGLTELKLWLTDLGRRDGVKPIGRTRFGAGDGTDSGGLGEGDKVVLGDESSDRAPGSRALLGNLDLDEPSMEDSSVSLGSLEPDRARGGPLDRAPTRVARTGQGDLNPVWVTGIEPTALSDLSLSVGDDSQELLQHVQRGARRRTVGVGVAIAVVLSGVAVAFWQLEASRRTRLEAEDATGGSNPPTAGVLTSAGQRAPSPARPPDRQGLPARSGSDRGGPRAPAAARPSASGRSGVDGAKVREWKERQRRWSSGSPPVTGTREPTQEPVTAPASEETPAWQPPPQPVDQPSPAPTPAPVGEDPAVPGASATSSSEPAVSPSPPPAEIPNLEPPPVSPMAPPATTEPPGSPN